MERNTSIAQRPHAGVHNSTGYTPEVHDYKSLNKWEKWNMQYTHQINENMPHQQVIQMVPQSTLLMLESHDINKWMSHPNENSLSIYAQTYELIVNNSFNWSNITHTYRDS